MNDNFSQENTPRMTDAQLDRLLDEQKTPPAPSDLLRARLHAEASRALAPDATAEGRSAPAAPAGGRFSPRQAFYGRVAAVLCLAAVVGMAVWLPAPGPARDGTVSRLAAEAVPLPGATAEGYDIGGNDAVTEDSDPGPAISLVGDYGTAISGIGLVQAAWSGDSVAGTGDGGELDDIPLD